MEGGIGLSRINGNIDMQALVTFEDKENRERILEEPRTIADRDLRAVLPHRALPGPKSSPAAVEFCRDPRRGITRFTMTPHPRPGGRRTGKIATFKVGYDPHNRYPEWGLRPCRFCRVRGGKAAIHSPIAEDCYHRANRACLPQSYVSVFRLGNENGGLPRSGLNLRGRWTYHWGI